MPHVVHDAVRGNLPVRSIHTTRWFTPSMIRRLPSGANATCRTSLKIDVGVVPGVKAFPGVAPGGGSGGFGMFCAALGAS